MELKEYEEWMDAIMKQKQEIENDVALEKELEKELQRLQQMAYTNLSAWDRVYLARHKDRPKAMDYIHALCKDFMEMHGDRYYGDDQAMVTGIATFHDIPVTVIAEVKGKSTSENVLRNFGMPSPEGYRKALRAAKQAEKFHRPIITFVDTPGAYPGKGAEERGQAEAIARCLYDFSDLNTIVLCVVISEGGSGGALALSVADRIIMLENAIYSILSPEGFASILYKDGSKAKEASEQMKLTAKDLLDKGIVDTVVQEPLGGVQQDFASFLLDLDKVLYENLTKLKKEKMHTLIQERYKKYRKIGVYE